MCVFPMMPVRRSPGIERRDLIAHLRMIICYRHLTIPPILLYVFIPLSFKAPPPPVRLWRCLAFIPFFRWPFLPPHIPPLYEGICIIHYTYSLRHPQRVCLDIDEWLHLLERINIYGYGYVFIYMWWLWYILSYQWMLDIITHRFLALWSRRG